MNEVFEKIMAILEAQDAKIKALEKQIEVYGGGMDTLLDVAYSDKDREIFNDFSGRHRAKFEPYLGIMDKLEGGDSFRAIYDRSLDMEGQVSIHALVWSATDIEFVKTSFDARRFYKVGCRGISTADCGRGIKIMNELQRRLKQSNYINQRKSIPILPTQKDFLDFIDRSL